MTGEGSHEVPAITGAKPAGGSPVFKEDQSKPARTFRKRKIVLFIATIVVGCLVFMWFESRTIVPVRLTFLHATNDPGSGNVVGVFQLKNESKEDTEIAGGLLHENKGGRWPIGRSTALQGPDCCPSRTSILLAIRMPTNGGPYRLAVRCIPVSKLTPKYYHSLRYRFGLFASRYRLIPRLWLGGQKNATYAEWRLHGITVVTSPAFSPSNPPR
jgi:hypothetical protein